MADFNPNKIKKGEDLAPVIFLAGTESYLIDFSTDVILKHAVPDDFKEFNTDIVYGSDTGAMKIIDIAKSYPMMTERRLVIVREFNKMSNADHKLIAAYATKPNPSTVLLLIYRSNDIRTKALKTIKEQAAFQICKPLYENQVLPWIEREVSRSGYTITPDAVSLLALQVGTQLQDIKNELEKIYLYLGENKEIDVETIAKVSGFRKEFTVFALQNALGNKDLNLALHIFRQIKLATAHLAIIAQLSRFYTNIMIATGFANNRSDNATLAKHTGVSPYFVADLHRFKRHYNINELTNALENIRLVDYSLKTFPVNPDSIMELLFIQIVRGYPANKLPYAGTIL